MRKLAAASVICLTFRPTGEDVPEVDDPVLRVHVADHRRPLLPPQPEDPLGRRGGRSPHRGGQPELREAQGGHRALHVALKWNGEFGCEVNLSEGL